MYLIALQFLYNDLYLLKHKEGDPVEGGGGPAELPNSRLVFAEQGVLVGPKVKNFQE